MSKINNASINIMGKSNIISRITQRIAGVLLILMLTSCSVYKSSFDCKPGKGIGCESVSRVNDLLDNDELDAYIDRKYDKNNNEVIGKKEMQSSRCNVCKNHKSVSGDKGTDGVRSRNQIKGEEIKVWFRGYTDEKGIKHDSHNVYVKAKGASDAK